MCGLCGLIEEQTDWTDSLNHQDIPRRQERYKRLKLINQMVKPYRVQVSDVHGVQYLVQTMTGKQAIANGLNELWQQIAVLTEKSIDVLDAHYLQQLTHQQQG